MRKKWIGLFSAVAVCAMMAAVPVFAADEQLEGVQDGIIMEESLQNPGNTASDNETGDVDVFEPGDGSGEEENPSETIAVTGIKLDTTEITLSEMTVKKTLVATVEPSDASNKKVFWSSDNTSVAKVTEDGIVTPVANGTTVIRVTTEDGELAAECEVTVDLYNGVCKSENGKYYYYVNGVVNTSYTGFASGENGDWYVEGGQVTFKKNSVIKDKTGALGEKGAWYYVVKSGVDYDSDTVAKNENGWWKITNGKVDFDYTGFAQNSKGDWYVEEGQVTFKKSGILKDRTGALGEKGAWYYVVKSGVDYDTNTVAKNENGWWKITNGKVDFDYTGFDTNSNGDWYVEEGRVTFKKNSVIKDATGALGTRGVWYYVVDSKVKYVNTVAKNENGWWKITNGKADFSYTGFASNDKGDWYVQKGQVTFKKNSVIKDTTGALGTKGTWYYVANSKVKYVDTVAKNENGWWKITNGKADFSYTGLAKNANGWWYIQKGQVNFSFTGIAQNSNGYWYVQKGQVNFNYNGTVTYNGQTWKVVNGKATASESIKYVKVTDSRSPLYGKTLKLYYDKNGNLIQNVTSKYTGSRTYEIYVNKTKNMVTVYTKDGDYYVPVKCFVCSTGGSGTPEGTFYTPDKYRWHELMGPCWGQWCTRINGGVLFHSVFYNSYNNNNALSVSAYNKLGTTASHGCVRLTAGDAKWIYDNCALKTKVVIYSSSGYEPLTKPSAYKLSSSHTWDPTDPNMYYKCQQRGCH